MAEVKNGSLIGWKRTPSQKEFIEACNAPIALFTCVDDVVAWANVRRGTTAEYYEVPF